MKIFIKCMFALGVILLAINLVGVFKSMRNPELYTLEHQIKNRINDVTIPYPDNNKILVRNEN